LINLASLKEVPVQLTTDTKTNLGDLISNGDDTHNLATKQYVDDHGGGDFSKYYSYDGQNYVQLSEFADDNQTEENTLLNYRACQGIEVTKANGQVEGLTALVAGSDDDHRLVSKQYADEHGVDANVNVAIKLDQLT
jgi:hypothetical protein